MIRIFSASKNEFFITVDKSEAELNRFLSKNLTVFFPQLIFIKSEFSLDGVVRSKGTSGRIDILAFNSLSNKFVIIELKKNLDKNIRSQAGDYQYFIESNFSEVYISAKEDHDIALPKRKDISKDNIELILIAKSFSDLDIDLAKKSNGEITLINYMWLETDLLLLHYLNNEPSGIIENNRTEKTKTEEVKTNINRQPVISTVTNNEDILVLRNEKKGVLAYGQKLSKGRDFKVFANSSVSNTEAPKFLTSAQKAFKKRREYENDGTIKNGKFSKDVFFSSISLAESLILGNSRDGKGWEKEK